MCHLCQSHLTTLFLRIWNPGITSGYFLRLFLLLSHEDQVCWSNPSRCFQNLHFFLSVSESSLRLSPHPFLSSVVVFNYVHQFFDTLPLRKVSPNFLECGPASVTHFYQIERVGIDLLWLFQDDKKVSFWRCPSQVICFGERQPPCHQDTQAAWRGHVQKKESLLDNNQHQLASIWMKHMEANPSDEGSPRQHIYLWSSIVFF